MSERPTIKQNSTTVYDKMSFEQVEFREYPKAIPMKDGKPSKSPYDERRKALPVVIVRNAEEEEALYDGAETVSEGGVERVRNEADERADLYVSLQQANVQFDKRWGIERLRELLAKAQNKDDSPVI